MNTLRRIPRHLVKAVAAIAVMVAAALPAAAVAGAASGPTLTGSSTVSYTAAASGFAIVGQGYTGTVYFKGTGFASDSLLGGTATLTTTAPGVTFSGVSEVVGLTTEVSATITTSSSTTPGFYPVTLTDDNGTATLAVGLGVDVGPQISGVTGNTGTAGGSTSTVTVTGTHLYGASVSLLNSVPANVASVTAETNTSLTFTVNNSTLAAGSYTFTVTSDYPANGQGAATGTYTVGAAAAATLTISSVTGPGGITDLPIGGITSGGTSVIPVTITGTGFEAGAIANLYETTGSACTTGTCTLATTANEKVAGSFTRASATSFTGTVTLSYGVIAQDLDVIVTNPDTTYVDGIGILGLGMAPLSTSASAQTPQAPAITAVSGSLEAAVSSILTVTTTTSFPLTTGSTVSIKMASGVSVAGKVLSVTTGATSDTATVQVNVPYWASTTTTAAVTTTSTSIAVTNGAGLTAGGGTAYLVNGTSVATVNYTAYANNTLTIPAGTVSSTFAAGSTVEWLFPTGAFTLSANNGTYTETFLTSSPTVVTANSASFTSTTGASIIGASLAPGTYTVNAFVPGFGFTTGAAVAFTGTANATGTVTVVNGNKATLSVTIPKTVASTTTLPVATVAGTDVAYLANANAANATVGESLTFGPNPLDATATTQTLVIASIGTAGANFTPVTFTSNFGQVYNAGDNVSGLQTANTSFVANMFLTNGAGEEYTSLGFLNTSTSAGTATASIANVGAGAGVGGAATAPEAFTLGSGSFGSVGTSGAAVWTVKTTVNGITFAPTSISTNTNTGDTLNVATTVGALTPAGTVVPVTISNGYVTYTSTFTVIAGPTVTAVTAAPTLGTSNVGLANGVTIGLTGSGFGTVTGGSFALTSGLVCVTTDPDVLCAISNSLTNSSTTLTVTLYTEPGAVNAPERVIIENTANYGAGNLANAFTVAGEPTATSVSPSTISAGTDPTITVTGTGFASAGLEVTGVFTPTGGAAGSSTSYTAHYVSATSVTVSGYPTESVPGSWVFTLGDGATWSVATPAVSVVAVPTANELYWAGTGLTSPANVIVAGSTSVPVTLTGSNFLAGTTVSIPAATGTFTTTLVTPNAVFGTLTLVSSTTVLPVVFTFSNTSGGKTTLTYDAAASPTITLPLVGATSVAYAGASGSTGTLTITGTGFYPGVTVTPGLAVLATFGTATVSNVTAGVSSACTANCNTITVPVTYISNTTGANILTSLTITNTTGYGSVTTASALSIDAGPVVTGTYYVPTFSSNVYITVTGSGFATGMTETSTNSAYTVNLVNVTPNTATLLVSTSSAATSGTSSTITFTNPDGGTVSFPLNGGPQVVASAKPSISRVSGLPVIIGKTTTLSINGKNLAGSSVSSNGAKVTVVNSSATHILIKVTPTKGKKGGAYKLTVSNAGGSATYTYSQKS